MKNKQSHFLKGSFALLLFMILGYVVKFYPENLVGIDQPIQSAIRGDLPAYLTAFFTRVTVLMNTRCCILGWRHCPLLCLEEMVYGGPPPHREFGYNWITRGNPETHLFTPTTSTSTFGPRRGLFFSKWPLLGSHPGLR